MSDGCGMKFSVLVVSSGFEGQRKFFALNSSRCFDACKLRFAAVIERQRSVHKALEAEMPHIHALTLKCLTPAQYNQ